MHHTARAAVRCSTAPGFRRSAGSASDSVFVRSPMLTFAVLGSSAMVSVGAYKMNEQNRRAKEAIDVALARLNESAVLKSRFGSPVRLVGRVEDVSERPGFIAIIARAPSECYDVFFGGRKSTAATRERNVLFNINGPRMAGGAVTMSSIGVNLTTLMVDIPGEGALQVLSAAELAAAEEKRAARAIPSPDAAAAVVAHAALVAAAATAPAPAAPAAAAKAPAAPEKPLTVEDSKHTWQSLGLTAVVGAAIGIGLSLYYNRYRKTVGPWEAVEIATKLVKGSPDVARLLGSPVRAGVVDFRSSKLENHFAQFAFPVTGDAAGATGSLLANAIKEGEHWRFTHLTLSVPGHKKLALNKLVDAPKAKAPAVQVKQRPAGKGKGKGRKKKQRNA